MKRLILTMTVLLLPVMFVSAQDRPAPAAQKFEQVAKQLNLTPAQEMKLIPILKEEAPKVEAIRSNTSLTTMQKMEQLRALHNQTDPQVRSILTPEQYQTLKTMRRTELQQKMTEKMTEKHNQ